MFRILFIFALWIGWFGHQPTRGKSIAPSIILMVDSLKRIDNMTQGGNVHLKKRKPIYGKGINDSLLPISSCNNCFAYSIWKGVLRRCYSKSFSKIFPTYEKCEICDEWLLFSNFQKWFNDPANGYKEGYHIDKDILVKGNKVYSQDTCCFVPPQINTLITKHDATRGILPIGVTMTTNKKPKYRASLRINGVATSVGCFDTSEDAFNAYKEAKEKHITEQAQKYYKTGEITEKVYNALLNYKIEITD